MSVRSSLVLDGAGLAPGFADPVHGAQAAFRALMTALAEPGRSVELGTGLAPPDGLSAAAAAVLLTLADFETPLWLPDDRRAGPVATYLRFHCGVALVADPAGAMLALLDAATGQTSLAAFDPGVDAYPDRSATLVVEVASLEGGRPVRLSGPGIETTRTIAPAGLAPGFWAEVAANHACYPLGVDLVLTAGTRALGLPRSTRIEEI